MPNLDTLLWILAAAIPLGMGVLGEHVSSNKPFYRYLFWGLGLVGMVIVISIGIRNQHAQQAWQAQLNKIQHNTETPPTVAVNVQPAPVILPSQSPSKSENNSLSPSDYSNAQIKDSAMALARRMRQLQQECNAAEGQTIANIQRSIRSSPDTTEDKDGSRQREAMTRLMQQEHENDSSCETRFGPLRAESRNLIFHLTNRVPAPQPLPSEIVTICLSTGPCAGPNPYEAVADYIEQLANLVPVKR